MAKLKKLPKRPKAGASLRTWDNYKKKCAQVQKDNRKTLADKKKKQKLIESTRGMRKV